jgi:hypothetical protein
VLGIFAPRGGGRVYNRRALTSRRPALALVVVLVCAGGVARAQAVKSAADHARTAFPLTGRHVAVACAGCHDPKQPAAARAKPAHDRCDRCHTDPHRGEASRACDTCHDTSGFRPARFEAEDHAKTRYPLAGAHLAVPCAGCHARPPAAPGFARGAAQCEDCHVDVHDGQFGFASGSCAGCHDDATWAPSTFGVKAHAATHLPLVGPHQVACTRCHAAPAAGLAVRWAGVSTECGACHEDRHLGQFPGRSCSACHAGAAWKPARGFDHAKTRAPLSGRHAQLACVSCHPRMPTPVGETEVYKLATRGADCSACHATPHGARVARTCTECHDERSWGNLHAPAKRFEHDPARTPLVGAHARASCSGCHRPARGPVPPMADCVACHADRHGGRAGARCESCHSSSTWKPDGDLVEHQKTRLPLVGSHAVQGCVRCHRDEDAGGYRGLDPSCQGCHLKTIAERPPSVSHSGPAFDECEECHTSMGWKPARLEHERFFRLEGAHTRVACVKCHGASKGARIDRTCEGCHARDLARARRVDHRAMGVASASPCVRCHGESAWRPARFPEHEARFAIASGVHAVACATCHTTPGVSAAFRCDGCHARAARQHAGVSGFSDEATACLRCHPRGRRSP